MHLKRQGLYRPGFRHLYGVKRHRINMPGGIKLRLNRGERPEPLPLPIQTSIASELAKQALTVQQYPSYSEFYAKLAAFHDVDVSNIVVGAGIEEFIRTLMFLACAPYEQAAVLWPTCAMYDIYAQVFSVDMVRVRPLPGVIVYVDDIIKAVGNNPRIVFLPNPGQPVPTYFSPLEISVLAKHLDSMDCILVVDEAHFGFGAESALSLIHSHDNLIVLRTFSKFWGAASIRVGYAIGQQRVIAPLNAARPSGEIAGPSMAVASALLDNVDVMWAAARETIRARDWAFNELYVRGGRLGITVFESLGFSLLIDLETPERAMAVAEALLRRGILVKVGFPYPVESCILAACGSVPLMQSFVAVLLGLAAEITKEASE